jgi:hypothetical protein
MILFILYAHASAIDSFGNRTNYSNGKARNGSDIADLDYKNVSGNVTILIPKSQIPTGALLQYQTGFNSINYVEWANNNGISLNYKEVPLSDLEYTNNLTKRCKLFQNDYDIAFINTIDFGLMGSMNCLEDLFSYSMAIGTGIESQTLYNSIVSDKLLGLPFTTYFSFLVYNKEM